MDEDCIQGKDDCGDVQQLYSRVQWAQKLAAAFSKTSAFPCTWKFVWSL